MSTSPSGEATGKLELASSSFSSFDPAVQVIQRKGQPLKPDGTSARGRGRPPKTTTQDLPPDVIEWEPAPGYTLDDPGVKFACDVASWIESYCYIRRKNTRVERIRFNRIQYVLMQFVAWRWNLQLAVEAITPKARQLGSSTYWECLLYALAELKPGFQAAIVAHDDNGVSQLWGKIRVIKQNIYRTSWESSSLINDAEGRAEWTTTSALFTGLIRSADALGKAGTPNGIHFSEVANFNDKGCDAEAGIASIRNSMARNEDTVEIYESTAKGKDKTFFRRCEEAKSPGSLSTLTLLFLPWYLDEGYTLSWEAWRKQLIASGKNDPGQRFIPTDEEHNLREQVRDLPRTSWSHPHCLTDAQLTWRRRQLAAEGGRLDVLKRYYPSTYEECFTASADSAFSEDTIAHYRRKALPPILRGRYLQLAEGTAQARPLIPDKEGPIRIWQHPTPNMPYVVGGDPGGSLANSDPYCAYVMHKITRQVVAQLHGHMDWDAFTRDILTLGYYYNTALLVVENNYNPAIANTLHQLNYPNLYYYYAQSTIEAHVGRTPGFNTNKKTRKELSSLVRTYARELLFECPDIEIATEMETFVWVPFVSAQNPDMEGDYKAIGGNHDDRIMALALILTQLDALIPQEALLPPPPPEEPPHPAYAWYLERQARKLTEQENRGGTSL